MTTGSERRALTLTVMSFAILRASARARVLLTPPQRVARGTQTVCSSTHALICTHSRSIHQRTLTNILDPHRNSTLWNRDGPAQGAVRTLTTAATAVPSDQLGFVPDQHPTTDLPIANADDRKIAILWTPQNWSRLYVSLCFFLYHGDITSLLLVITFGCEITVGVPAVFTPSRNKDCSTRSRCVVAVRMVSF